MSRRLLALALLAALVIPASTAALPEAPPGAPEALAAGFAIAPLATAIAPTALSFGPGDADGPDLYATTIAGDVVRFALAWGDAGPSVVESVTFATGFSLPLGLAFDDGGNLYVADSIEGLESGRIDGRVTRLGADGSETVVVSGLPNGRHNTNNLRFGPDGRLYITNGNANDNGIDGGEQDVYPYSGAILSVDAAEVTSSPAVLRWQDDAGARIDEDEIATHPLNEDFASKVAVFASGFRNVYDVAFAPDGTAYTATNGADDPSSQDLFYRVQAGTDYGYPYCYNEGEPGATGEGVQVVPNPVFANATRCAAVEPADALLGWHVCATGLDAPTAQSQWPEPYSRSVYVAECGPFFPEPQNRGFSTHDTGHKIARVELDAQGGAVRVSDFVIGLALPTDALFGPDGALYIADAAGVHRVAPLSLPPPLQRTGPIASPPVVALPGAVVTTYATPVAVAPVGGELEFINGDLFRHNVVSHAYGSGDAPWCNAFPQGRCPLFWSLLIGLGGRTPVLGLDRIEAGESYSFYCTLHPNMRGTLVALPES